MAAVGVVAVAIGACVSLTRGARWACYDRRVVEDLVRVAGWATLKLVTLGAYRTDDDAIFLEGGIGLFVWAAMIALIYRFSA